MKFTLTRTRTAACDFRFRSVHDKGWPLHNRQLILFPVFSITLPTSAVLELWDYIVLDCLQNFTKKKTDDTSQTPV